jgi:hypothetical protein
MGFSKFLNNFFILPISIPPVRLVDGNGRRRRTGNARTLQCHQF